MTLRDLLGDGPAVEIAGLAYDNRAVEPGTLFFCVPGFTRDGHEFAPDAVERGAAALVVARPLGLGVPEVLVDDVRAAMAIAAARFHGDPTARLPVVGITGTNGKTTTAFLVRSLLEAAGRQCGLLGTVTSVIGGRGAPDGAHHAGGDRPPAHVRGDARRRRPRVRDGGLLARARAAARRRDPLRRRRVHQPHAGPPRLPPDMEDYFLAKRRLFASPLTAARVANVDDAYGRRLADEFPDAVTFAIEAEADYRATGVRTGFAGTRFTFETPDGEFDVPCRCPGASTSPTRSAPGRRRGRSGVERRRRCREAGRVPGRFEPVDEGQPFAVLVDYSHTPDSLENVLRAARELAAGRVIAVFGAGGDRDRGKRPLMGEIGARLADVAVVTSDNPRSEDPEAIIDEILAGRRAASVEHDVDRRAAIQRAVGAGGAGRRRGHRRQGARAGPGVRGRPQGAVRRRRGGARGAARCAEGLGRGAGRRGGGRAARARPRAGSPRAGDIDSRDGRARRPVRRACRASTSTAASSPRAALRRAPGACSSAPRWAAASSAASCWPPTTRSPRSARWRARGGASSARR